MVGFADTFRKAETSTIVAADAPSHIRVAAAFSHSFRVIGGTLAHVTTFANGTEEGAPYDSPLP